MKRAIPFPHPITIMNRVKGDAYKRLRFVASSRDFPRTVCADMSQGDKCVISQYTLCMPRMLIHVVNSTNLIPVVQRQLRTVAFRPFAARVFKYAVGESKSANYIMAMDMAEDYGSLMNSNATICPAASPGPSLDASYESSVSLSCPSILGSLKDEDADHD